MKLNSSIKKNIVIDKNVTDIGQLNHSLNEHMTEQNKQLFRGQKYLSKMLHSTGIRAYTMTNMFYKNWRAYHLCLNHAEKNHIKYDLVIRARPDLDFNQPLNDGVISQIIESKNRVAVPSFAWNNKAVSDAFAYGSMESMAIYTNIYLRLEEYYYNTNINMKPDFLLKTHLESHGIEILLDDIPHNFIRPEYNTKYGKWYL